MNPPYLAMTTLDAADHAILRELRLNARASIASIAGEVGLSASSCLRRIRAMEASGAIAGYTTILGHAAREEGVAVIVTITLERQTKDYLDRFERAVRRHPEIHECYLMTGGADYFLRVEAENQKAFERIHTEVLSTLPGVLRIHSSFSIRNVLSARRG